MFYVKDECGSGSEGVLHTRNGKRGRGMMAAARDAPLRRRNRHDVEPVRPTRAHDSRDGSAAAPDSASIDVTYAVGFASVSAFNHVFRTFTGETPSSYRKRLHPH